MSWQKLNPNELKAMRQLIFASTDEAARCVAGLNGKHPARSWQRWESGQYEVPDDVESEIYALISQRNECINGMVEHEEVEQVQKWYSEFALFEEDFPGTNEVWWKLHQSVLSHLFAEGGDIELRSDVDADRDSYIYKFFAQTPSETEF